MSKKKLKKRISALEHVVGRLMQKKITDNTLRRLDDLEEIVFDVPRAVETDVPNTVDELFPAFNMIGPAGDN